jgi:hypothetical protein
VAGLTTDVGGHAAVTCLEFERVERIGTDIPVRPVFSPASTLVRFLPLILFATLDAGQTAWVGEYQRITGVV